MTKSGALVYVTPTRRSFMLALGAGVTSLLAQRGPDQRPKNIHTIRLLAQIDFAVANQLINSCEAAMKLNVDELVLNISSPGGITDSALAAYQYMRGRRVPLTVHNFGSVESAAVILFCAGAKRYSTSNARFMIHQPFVDTGGRQLQIHEADASEVTATLKNQTDTIVRILAETTGKTESTTRSWVVSHVVWTAKEALANNLIHEIRDDIVNQGEVASIVGPVGSNSSSAFDYE